MGKNDAKITKEFCWKNNLIFFPETEAEAGFIQQKLFDMGYAWSSGSTEIDNISDSLQMGIVLLNSKIYTRGESDTRDYRVCKSSQLGSVEEFMTPVEQVTLREEFNELATIVREMSKKVDEMYAVVMTQQPKKTPPKI